MLVKCYLKRLGWRLSTASRPRFLNFMEKIRPICPNPGNSDQTEAQIIIFEGDILPQNFIDRFFCLLRTSFLNGRRRLNWNRETCQFTPLLPWNNYLLKACDSVRPIGMNDGLAYLNDFYPRNNFGEVRDGQWDLSGTKRYFNFNVIFTLSIEFS